MNIRLLSKLWAVVKAIWKFAIFPALIGIFAFGIVLITGIGELVFPASITIRNNTGVDLRNVQIIGEAGSSTPTDLAPGQTTSGKFRLAGASQKGVCFTPPDGQAVEEWYLVSGIGLSREIEVTINPNLKITKQEK
jgi:hypothetical protein